MRHRVFLFGETGTLLIDTIKHMHFQQGFKKRKMMRAVELSELSSRQVI